MYPIKDDDIFDLGKVGDGVSLNLGLFLFQVEGERIGYLRI